MKGVKQTWKHPIPLTPAHQPTSLSWHSPILGHLAFSRPKASPALDVQQRPSSATYASGSVGPSMCTLWLVVYSLGSQRVQIGYYCFFYGAASSFSSFFPFSSSSTGDLVLNPMAGWERLPPYLSCTGWASQETAISDSCQLALVGIHNSFWVW